MTSADYAIRIARRRAREHNALMRAIDRAKRGLEFRDNEALSQQETPR